MFYNFLCSYNDWLLRILVDKQRINNNNNNTYKLTQNITIINIDLFYIVVTHTEKLAHYS